jgi:adenosylcobinamide-GDP ribazoletransferase
MQTVPNDPVDLPHRGPPHSDLPDPPANDGADPLRDDDGGLFTDCVMAIRFFSRLPTGDSPHRPPRLERIAPALPFASLIIGIAPALLLVLLLWLGVPTGFAVVLAVLAQVIVTGAMAEDALADASDGLFGGYNPVRRLEIMRDSRHGTFGVVAIVLFIAAKLAAWQALAGDGWLDVIGVTLAAGIIARSAGLWLAVALGPARADGAGAAAGRLARTPFALGLVFAAILGVILAGPFVGYAGTVAAAVFVAAAVAGWTALCKRLVGGQTGDLIGAGIALAELAALTGFLMFA